MAHKFQTRWPISTQDETPLPPKTEVIQNLYDTCMILVCHRFAWQYISPDLRKYIKYPCSYREFYILNYVFDQPLNCCTYETVYSRQKGQTWTRLVMEWSRPFVSSNSAAGHGSTFTVHVVNMLFFSIGC